MKSCGPVGDGVGDGVRVGVGLVVGVGGFEVVVGFGPGCEARGPGVRLPRGVGDAEARRVDDGLGVALGREELLADDDADGAGAMPGVDVAAPEAVLDGVGPAPDAPVSDGSGAEPVAGSPTTATGASPGA